MVTRLITWILSLLGPFTVNLGGRKFILDLSRDRLLPVMAGADGSDDDDGKGDDDDDKSKSKSGGGDDDDDDDEDEDDEDDDDKSTKGKSDDEIDWKAMARRHERRAKQERKKREALEAKQTETDNKQKSDLQKAIDNAREEGKREALTEAQKERRADRLEVAVTRLASRGVKIDDKKVKFADSEDALVHIERAIRRGDIDEDDVFDDDGKVIEDGLAEALSEILTDKPHLALRDRSDDSDDDGKKGKRRGADGGADGGRGDGGGKSREELSVEELIKRKMQPGR